MKTWKIAYTITEGEHEYGDYFTRDFTADTLTESTVAEAIADHWDITDPEERQDFLRELTEEGYAFLPGENRTISDLGWEVLSPIVVTVRNGIVESVTGLSESTTLEVRDFDSDDRDEQGEPVPVVSLWEGPL
jgi:hypothetical protein